jgi:hypothetical protein
LFDVSKATYGVVFHKPTRQLLICSTGDAIDRQVSGDLPVVAKFFFRIKFGVLLFRRFFVQLFDTLVNFTRMILQRMSHLLDACSKVDLNS